MILLQIKEESVFNRRVNTDKPDFVSFLVFEGAAASFTAKMLPLETVATRQAILSPVPKQNARKLLSTDLVNTDYGKLQLREQG